MSQSEVPEVHARHAFLAGLSGQQRARLACGARSFSAAPGEYLAREGDVATAFYLIQTGTVQIGTHLAERGSVPIQTVGSGEVVGWSWLLPPFRWQFDARALDAVQGLAFDATWLRQQCEEDHDLGFQLLKQLLAVISNRLAATRVQRLDIYK